MPKLMHHNHHINITITLTFNALTLKFEASTINEVQKELDLNHD
jgi:hypothetical protein